MRAAFAIAALAGSAIAAPGYGYKPEPKNEVVVEHVVVETVVQTIYVTEGYEVPQATPTPEPVYQAPAVTTVVYEEPAKPTSKYEAPAYTPAPVPEQPKPTPQPQPQPSPPTSTGYMAVVDEWRAKLGLKALKHSAKLEANALKCAQNGNGQMVHQLNAGTFAQVLAPGSCTENFTHVFVGGWLCEMPQMAGLDDVCAKQSEGWSYQGQTGHAEILTSPAYSEIGCADAGGIVACDLA